MTITLGARFGALTTAALLGGSLIAATPSMAIAADAATIEVTSEANDGPGSLRAAFETANAQPDVATTVTFAPSVRTVTVSEMLYSEVSLTIRGNGQDNTEIKQVTPEPGGFPALLGFASSSVQLSGVTLTGSEGWWTSGLIISADAALPQTSAVTDTTIRGFGEIGLRLEGLSGHDFTMSDTTLTGNGIGMSVWGVSDAELTVTDSVIADNEQTGLQLRYYTPSADAGATLERVRLSGNGGLDEEGLGESAGGLSLSGEFTEFTGAVSPVRIVDSVFENNVGRSAGAIEYHPTWGEPNVDAPPYIHVSGTTFVGNIGGGFEEGEPAGAASILLASPPMVRAAVDAAPADEALRYPVLLVENSTFDGSAALAAGKSSALVGDGYGNNKIKLDQVTAVSSIIDLVGRGSSNEVAITRSAIDSGAEDPFAFSSDESTEPNIVTVSDSVFTQPSENVDVEAGTSQVIPLAALELGPLADNGGPTQTMLPSETSPLVDAVTEAGALTVDQRGFPRPVNGAADIGAVEVEMREQPVLESTVSILADVKVANGETAVFTAERTAPTPARADAEALPAVTVTIATSDGTAIAGTDYTASELTLSWAEGESGAKPFAVPTAKLEGPKQEREFSVTLSEPSEHLTIERATATGTLPAIEGSAVVPEVTPPGKGDKGDIAETGGSGPIGWIIAALLAVLAGAGVLTARRTLRQ